MFAGKIIGPDTRNFNRRVSLGRKDPLVRTFPKIAGMAVIPAMGDNSFHFKNGGDKHNGEVTECIEGNYRLVLNKLSDSEVKKILALIADIK